jgi:type IV pilus assembly protein PilA
MFCSRCGQAIPEGATLCANCGQQTTLANAPLAELSSQPSAGAPESLAPEKTSSLAIASLIFGILFIFFPLSIPAIVFGHIALSQIKKSSGRLGGRGMAIAGLVLGYLGIAMIPLILIIAAIAIPNLLRARIAANEASAVGLIRTINTAQVTYQAAFPAVGYARSLASLGGVEPCTSSPVTACLVDNATLETAPSGKRGYIFTVVTSGDGSQYVVRAVPVARNQTGVRSFCSTEDGVIRFAPNGGAAPDHDSCVSMAPIR